MIAHHTIYPLKFMNPVDVPDTGGTFSLESAIEIAGPIVAIGAIALLTYAGLKMVVTGKKPFGNKNI